MGKAQRGKGSTLRDEARGSNEAQLTLGLSGQGEDLCLLPKAMKSHQQNFK